MNITEVGFTDLISQLVATTSLDVVPVVGSSSFVTVDSVRQRASEYVALCGGRVTSAELQSYLNIEKLHVDNIIQKMLSESGEGNKLLFVGGELITQEYLDSIVIEVDDLLQRHRRKCCGADGNIKSALRIGVLVTHFQLPLDVMTTLAKTHFPGETALFGAVTSTPLLQASSGKKGNKKKKRANVDEKVIIEDVPLTSTTDETSKLSSFQNDSVMSSVYGYCLGAVQPVPLSAIFSAVAHGLDDEAALIRVMHQLTTSTSDGSLRLPGSCNNKEYIPHIFANQQRIKVDECFRSNNLISFVHLQSLHVQSKPLEYILKTFDNAVLLDTCIVSSVLKDVCVSSIEEVTSSFPFAVTNYDLQSGGVGAPWLNLASTLPSDLTDADIETLLRACGVNLNSKSCAVSLQTTANYDNFLVNNQFISSMKDILVADAASATTAESMAIASVQQTKSKGSQNVASKSGLAAISTTNSKKPSNTASKHSVALDEDVDDGKAKKGKGKKGNISSNRNSNRDDDDGMEVTSKTAKKSGKRGKETVAQSIGHHHGSTMSDDSAVDIVPSLVAPFITKKRIMNILLEFCLKANLEVHEAIEINNNCNSDASFDDEKSGSVYPFFESLYDLLLATAHKEYAAAAERALLSTAKGTHDSHIKREMNRDQKFEEMWSTLQVSSKILISFEKECTQDTVLYDHLFQIHSLILAKNCLPIVAMLTDFCCWENDVGCPQVSRGKVGLSHEQRCQLQNDLPQDTGNLLVKLWKSLGAHDNGDADKSASVWKFIDILSSNTFKESFNLIVHKIDKKKEKSQSFAFKQSLLDAVKGETVVEKLCPLVLSLAVYQLTNCVLELPSNLTTQATAEGSGMSHPVIFFLLTWLSSSKFSSEDVEAVRILLQSAIDDPDGDADLAMIVDAAKQAVLKKPTATS